MTEAGGNRFRAATRNRAPGRLSSDWSRRVAGDKETGDSRAIAMFDSGIGGLTVVQALRRAMPGEDIVYFGDTARVPYGIKSPETVLRFGRENCEFLMRFDPKMIVVACNTASAAALPELEQTLTRPVCGVVRPGAEEAAGQARGRPIGVIATEATVNSNAYKLAIQKHAPEATVFQHACPLLVPMVEEGRDSGDPLVTLAVAEYLRKLKPLDPGVLVLGCTHYPLLREAIAAFMGPAVALVDSAEATARQVSATLGGTRGLNPRGRGGSLSCYVSDNPQRFREIGQRFLGEPIRDVTCLSPEEFFALESAVP